MRRGFTLIEIIVSVLILVIISGGALVYLNNFTSRKKLDKGRDEIVASLKLVQNYAKTKQLPVGSAATELHYVTLTVNPSGYLEVNANGDISQNYFKNLVNTSDISVTTSPSPIIFWAGGRLSFDTSLTKTRFYGVNDTAVVNIFNYNQGGGKYQIIINALGQVINSEYSEWVAPTSAPTPVLTAPPTPGSPTLPPATVTPTIRPSLTPIPCKTFGQSCSLFNPCCNSLWCYNGTCQYCRSNGADCQDNFDCCSDYCDWQCAEPPSLHVCVSPATNPYFIEYPLYSGKCVQVLDCGFSNQICL